VPDLGLDELPVLQAQDSFAVLSAQSLSGTLRRSCVYPIVQYCVFTVNLNKTSPLLAALDNLP
jgi:hypothetical protein